MLVALLSRTEVVPGFPVATVHVPPARLVPRPLELPSPLDPSLLVPELHVLAAHVISTHVPPALALPPQSALVLPPRFRHASLLRVAWPV